MAGRSGAFWDCAPVRHCEVRAAGLVVAWMCKHNACLLAAPFSVSCVCTRVCVYSACVHVPQCTMRNPDTNAAAARPLPNARPCHSVVGRQTVPVISGETYGTSRHKNGIPRSHIPPWPPCQTPKTSLACSLSSVTRAFPHCLPVLLPLPAHTPCPLPSNPTAAERAAAAAPASTTTTPAAPAAAASSTTTPASAPAAASVSPLQTASPGHATLCSCCSVFTTPSGTQSA